MCACVYARGYVIHTRVLKRVLKEKEKEKKKMEKKNFLVI